MLRMKVVKSAIFTKCKKTFLIFISWPEIKLLVEETSPVYHGRSSVYSWSDSYEEDNVHGMVISLEFNDPTMWQVIVLPQYNKKMHT